MRVKNLSKTTLVLKSGSLIKTIEKDGYCIFDVREESILAEIIKTYRKMGFLVVMPNEEKKVEIKVDEPKIENIVSDTVEKAEEKQIIMKPKKLKKQEEK